MNSDVLSVSTVAKNLYYNAQGFRGDALCHCILYLVCGSAPRPGWRAYHVRPEYFAVLCDVYTSAMRRAAFCSASLREARHGFSSVALDEIPP
jgi:hypothetical protein